jgi:hypothetical protein
LKLFEVRLSRPFAEKLEGFFSFDIVLQVHVKFVGLKKGYLIKNIENYKQSLHSILTHFTKQSPTFSGTPSHFASSGWNVSLWN